MNQPPPHHPTPTAALHPRPAPLARRRPRASPATAALALDLMGEFRPIIADSVALTLINNRILTPADFISHPNAAALKPQARKKLIHAYETRLHTLHTHPIFAYRISCRTVLEVQARLLARTLTGEIPSYPPFTTR